MFAPQSFRGVQMTRRNRTEWAKAMIGILAGALMLAYAQFLWLAHHDFFLIQKDEAESRRYWNQVYSGIAVCPIDEMAGVD